MPRDSFFDRTVRVLSAQDCVSDLRAVKDSVIPVVKLCIGGLQIDIQYCCLPADVKLPKTMLKIDNLAMLRLDPASLRSIAAIRDAERISEVVPDYDSFRLLLFFIKFWAKSMLNCLMVVFNLQSRSFGLFWQHGIPWRICLRYFGCSHLPGVPHLPSCSIGVSVLCRIRRMESPKHSAFSSRCSFPSVRC